MASLTAGRFAAPELLQLGPPPPLAALPYETLLANAKTTFLAYASEFGLAFDVQTLETDPAIILEETASYRDLLRRQAIDDAIAQTFLGSATGAMLDQRAADYGVLRRVLVLADPDANPPVAEVLESDDSLRARARLAWEALSVAGPNGAYVFHALDAHPEIFDAVAYGPETEFVDPGEVLVVLQSRSDTGIPTQGQVDAVAARLDAHEVIDAEGDSTIRPVRDDQTARPLGARVIVQAAKPTTFNVSATLYVRPGPDSEALRVEALTRLSAYLASRRRIGMEVPRSGIIAALHMVGTDGLPVVDEVTLSFPSSDVVPDHDELATVGTVTLVVEIR